MSDTYRRVIWAPKPGQMPRADQVPTKVPPGAPTQEYLAGLRGFPHAAAADFVIQEDPAAVGAKVTYREQMEALAAEFGEPIPMVVNLTSAARAVVGEGESTEWAAEDGALAVFAALIGTIDHPHALRLARTLAAGPDVTAAVAPF